jgi:ankyrin repeat protein
MRQDAFDIMRCLLNAGANPNNITDGVNALFPSVFSCNLSAVKMLLEAGTDPLHIEPVSQHTLLHELTSAHKISPECLQIAQLLLDAGVDKTALNESGKLAYDYVDTSASNTSLARSLES